MDIIKYLLCTQKFLLLHIIQMKSNVDDNMMT